MLTAITCSALLISAAISVHAAAVQSSSVQFGPEAKHTGYLVKPSGEGPFPGIVVIHEWWGLNDNIRNQATKLAEAGYVALAVDLFGKSTTDPKQAAQQVQNLDQKAATAELLAATEYLRSRPCVRPDRIGSLGWCFGGAMSLNLAINDPKLAAAVIYYGRQVTDPKKLGQIYAPILGIFGEADESIPMEQLKAFQAVLGEAKVANEIHTYPGAQHAFANPSGGERYKPEAAADAWEKTMAFLSKHLKR